MRAALILLASTGCSQLFGLESPERIDGGLADARRDAAADGASDASTLAMVSFQNGTGGYTSARDTYIDAGAPNASRENDNQLRIRSADRWALIEFEALFGSSATQLPPMATIASAHLELVIANNNCEMSIADIVVSWPDAVTYNTFGPTPGPQMTEDFAAPFAVIPVATVGKVSVDVTASVQRFQSTPASNNGWLLVGTGGQNDCTVRSSEDLLNSRPKLVIAYTP